MLTKADFFLWLDGPVLFTWSLDQIAYSKIDKIYLSVCTLSQLPSLTKALFFIFFTVSQHPSLPIWYTFVRPCIHFTARGSDDVLRWKWWKMFFQRLRDKTRQDVTNVILNFCLFFQTLHRLPSQLACHARSQLFQHHKNVLFFLSNLVIDLAF